MRASIALYYHCWIAISSLGATALPAKSKAPVCIVGAGPAGLTAANRLESKGYETVIFEKQAEVGGKSQAYYDDNGIFHPLGAAFFSNASWPETVKVVNDSGVLSVPFSLEAGARDEFLFNYSTGAYEPLPTFPFTFLEAIASEIPRYTAFWEKTVAPISVPGYKNGVPDELTVPAAQWFAENNYTALPVVLVNPLALYGYGDIRVVPILYFMQYITPDVLGAFLGAHTAYFIDFHAVWVQWSKKFIKGAIHTNANVHTVDRSNSEPVIKWTQGDTCCGCKEMEQKCSSVIMAFPPTLDALNDAGIQLSKDEHQVFSAVGVHNYFSQAVHMDLPYGVSYVATGSSIALPPPNVGEPVAVLQLHPNSSIATSWSWGPYRQFECEQQARELSQTTLSKINKDPRDVNATSTPLASYDIRAFRKWDYFPHFDTPQLKENYYGKLNDLQGKQNTFWASALSGMETVEFALRAGEDIVSCHY